MFNVLECCVRIYFSVFPCCVSYPIDAFRDTIINLLTLFPVVYEVFLMFSPHCKHVPSGFLVR